MEETGKQRHINNFRLIMTNSMFCDKKTISAFILQKFKIMIFDPKDM